MNDRTVALVAKRLRHRKKLTQVELGRLCGVSQGTVSNLELGRLRPMSVRTLRAILSALDADVYLDIRWREGIVDLLIDERHAGLVGVVADALRTHGWQVVPEVSYSEFGERGSIDLVAWHGPTRTLLVVEVKTELVSLEASLRKHDEKVRLAPRVVRERFGWQPVVTARLLVLPAESTARRRVDQHRAVLDRALPARGRAVRAWLREPAGPLAGIWFVSATNGGDRASRPISPKRVRERKRQEPAA